MSNVIKIGNLEIDSFKVGAADCSIYLGTTKLYPLTPSGNVITYTASSQLNVAQSAFTPNATAETYDSATSAGTIEFSAPVTAIGREAFGWKESLISIELPNSVTSIGYEAFDYCRNLTTVNIPSSVTYIDESVFYYCRSLTNITLPSSITSIPSRTFYSCRVLANVEIPSTVTSIGDSAFYQCSGFTSVTIPSGVTSIGSYAFQSCSGLTGITCLATTPPSLPSSSNAFDDTNNCPIYVPCESVSAYQTAWSDYASRITCIQPTGHTYVDLGLPSGTKWATMNVGASSETDYGDYYQYGKGASTYQTTSGESHYRSSVDPLPATADTAVQVWGDNWHIPTKTQFEELTANTTFTWETNFNNSGINGAKYTAQNGNYIFLPASGVYYNGTLSVLGTYGEYLSSTPNGSQEFYFLMFDSGGKTIYNNHRYLGMSVRPVMDN